MVIHKTILAGRDLGRSLSWSSTQSGSMWNLGQVFRALSHQILKIFQGPRLPNLSQPMFQCFIILLVIFLPVTMSLYALESCYWVLPKAFSRLSNLSLTSQSVWDLITSDETRFLKKYLPQSSSMGKALLLCSCL